MRALMIGVVLLTTGMVARSAPLPTRLGVVADTIVLRVSSGNARSAFFSGVLITGDSGTGSRRFAHQQAPFEVRLPTTALHVMIRGDDNALMRTEVFVQSAGHRLASATGQSAGTAMLYAHRNGEVGFTDLPRE